MATTKKTRLAAPTLQYLLQLKTDHERIYDDDNKQIKRMRAVRELTQPVVLPEKHRLVAIEVRDPTIADEIARVTATLSVNNPKLVVHPTRPTDTAQQNATLREKWTWAALVNAGSHETPDTFKRMVDATVGDGAAWLKFVWTPDTYERRYSIKPEQFEEDVETDEDEPNEDEPDGETEDQEDQEEAKEKPRKKALKSTNWEKYNQATEDAKKGAGVPFRWVCVDTLNVMPIYEAGEVKEVLEVSEKALSSTFRRFRLDLDSKGNIVDANDNNPVAEELGPPQARGKVKASSHVQFIEHWDDTWVSYVVLHANLAGETNGKIVAQHRHGYGRHPYFWSPGLFQSHWRHRKTGWSISESKRYLVEYKSFLMTIHAQVAARDAFTPLFRRIPAASALSSQQIGDDLKPRKDENWALGAIYEGKPGEDLVPIQFPDVAKALREEITMISEAIEKLETPRVSGQIGSGLEGAGFAVNQILSEARLRFDPIASSIERCLGEITRFMWHLVRTKVKEDVWVYQNANKESGWLKAGPTDLTEDVQLEWKLDPQQPSARLIESRYWNERLTAGTASKDMAIEALGDNPDEVRFLQILDLMRNSPWYKAYLERYVLANAQRGDLLQLAAQAEHAAQTGVVQPGDQSGPGSNGAQGTAPGPMGQGGQGGPPDMGNAAMAPNGQGAAPVPPPGPPGPPNGSVSGAGAGAVMPTQSISG